MRRKLVGMAWAGTLLSFEDEPVYWRDDNSTVWPTEEMHEAVGFMGSI